MFLVSEQKVTDPFGATVAVFRLIGFLFLISFIGCRVLAMPIFVDL